MLYLCRNIIIFVLCVFCHVKITGQVLRFRIKMKEKICTEYDHTLEILSWKYNRCRHVSMFRTTLVKYCVHIHIGGRLTS
jgi:hypothetical protein